MNNQFDGNSIDSVMEVNNLFCVLNLPQIVNPKLNEGKEVVQSLPPYAPRKAFKVDEYECPDEWMHGSGLAGSYFVPVQNERGMWLDFNRNFSHSHHVAILISIQGVNPLDGQSLVDGSFSLNQYKTKCPKHDIEFKSDRFCEKCNYKWVPQNYLTTTGSSYGLWLDGFLAEDGVVRQYYFTEEESKGVAHQIIGSEKKVYSIGVAFYLSKEPKPVVNYRYRNDYSTGLYGCSFVPDESLKGITCSMPSFSSNSSSGRSSSSRNVSLQSPRSALKSLDIAAGAKINQKVYADPESLDFWSEKPAGLLYINYASVEQVKMILEAGKKDRTNAGEGFLAGLKTGV